MMNLIIISLTLILATVVAAPFKNHVYFMDTTNDSVRINTNTESYYIALKIDSDVKKAMEKYLLDVSNPDSKNYGLYLSEYNIEMRLKPTTFSTAINLFSWMRNKNIESYCRYYIDSFVCKDVPEALSICSNPVHKLDCMIKGFEHVIDFIELAHFKSHTKESGKKFGKKSGKKIKKVSNTVDTGYVSREAIQVLYNYVEYKAIGSTMVSVGVMEFDNERGYTNTSVIDIQKNNYIRQNEVKHNIGTNDLPVSDESTLDISMVAQLSGNSSDLWFWNNPRWLYSSMVEVMNSANVPEVISISWGWNENRQCSYDLGNCTVSQLYVERVNYEFMKAGLRGITIIVSSGDSGSCGRSNMDCESEPGYAPLNPSFPATANYVLSVGGTVVMATNNTKYNYTTPICTTNKCSTGTTESISEYNKVKWSSGSGFSNYFEQNSWQTKLVSNYLSSNVTFPDSKFYNKSGRAYPDVVAVSNFCPVYSYDGSKLLAFAGTSCSAPIWAGLIAQINYRQKSRRKPVVGFVNQLLYKIKQDYPSCWNVIEKGNTRSTESGNCGVNNGFESDGSGEFNLVSGLGSPNMNCILNAIQNIIF